MKKGIHPEYKTRVICACGSTFLCIHPVHNQGGNLLNAFFVRTAKLVDAAGRG